MNKRRIPHLKVGFSRVLWLCMAVAGLASFSRAERLASGRTPNSPVAAVTLEEGFLTPPPASRPDTWWHWMNGNISREGITADLEAMAEIGLGGAYIFNVSCDIPEGPVDYLSPEWLDLVHHAASEAGRLELELGIKNCAGWSTSGGPWIGPSDSMQTIYWSEVDVTGGQRLSTKIPVPEVVTGEPGDDLAELQSSYRDIVVLAFPAGVDWQMDRWHTKTLRGTARAGMQPSLPMAGMEKKSDRPVVDPDKIIDLSTQLADDSTLHWDAPEGEWTIVRLGHGSTGVVNHPAPRSGTGLEADKLSRRAIDRHWKHGIQPILDHLGQLAGQALTRVVIDSYEAKFHSWTPNMPAEFEQRRGYEMGPYLVSLTGRPVGDIASTERFFDDFRRTIGDLMTENYYGYMAELCHREGLKIAIEPYRGPFESMAVAMQADLPTGEFFFDLGYGVPFLKICSSAANLRGLPVTAAEAFTGIDGWRNHPGNLKYAGDRAWAEGVNQFVFHRYAHQPWADLVPGMTMGPYGIHFERTNTWWKPGGAWIDYITRSQFLLQRGTTVADILCFAGEAVPNTSPPVGSLKEAGHDYDLCGTDMFYELSVEDKQIVLPSGRRYRVLLMGPTTMPYLSLRAARKLRELVAAGATVIGQKPTHTPSLTGFPEAEAELLRIADEIWNPADPSTRSGKAFAFSGSKFLPAIQELDMEPDVILPDDSTELYWIHRRNEDEEIYFVSNQARRAQQVTVGFRVTGRLPELWDAVDGSLRPAAGWHVKGAHTFVPLSFQTDGSIFVVFRKAGKPPADPVISAVASTPRAETQEPASIPASHLLEKSWLTQLVHDLEGGTALRAWHNDDYTLTRASGKTRVVSVDGVRDRVVIDGPWEARFQPGRGAPKSATLDELAGWSDIDRTGIHDFSGTATLTAAFDFEGPLPGTDEEVWLDLGDVHVMAEVELNRENLGTLWAPPYRVEVGSKLRAGENTLTVSVTNLWVNRLIADEASEDGCRWLENGALAEWPEWIEEGKLPEKSRRITFTTWKHWKAEDVPPPSGLRGPVVLRFAKRVQLKD